MGSANNACSAAFYLILRQAPRISQIAVGSLGAMGGVGGPPFSAMLSVGL